MAAMVAIQFWSPTRQGAARVAGPVDHHSVTGGEGSLLGLDSPLAVPPVLTVEVDSQEVPLWMKPLEIAIGWIGREAPQMADDNSTAESAAAAAAGRKG